MEVKVPETAALILSYRGRLEKHEKRDLLTLSAKLLGRLKSHNGFSAVSPQHIGTGGLDRPYIFNRAFRDRFDLWVCSELLQRHVNPIDRPVQKIARKNGPLLRYTEERSHWTVGPPRTRVFLHFHIYLSGWAS